VDQQQLIEGAAFAVPFSSQVLEPVDVAVADPEVGHGVEAVLCTRGAAELRRSSGRTS